MYLEMLSEFSSFNTMASMLENCTTTFLKCSGFLNKNKQSDTAKSNQKMPRSVASSSNISKRALESPYLTHSSSVLSSSTAGNSQYVVTSNSDSATGSLRRPSQNDEPAYITWWDPNTQKMLYIDKRTGNSYVKSITFCVHGYCY